MVRESPIIALPDESPMVGIVTFIDRQVFGAHSPKVRYEDMIGVLWLATGVTEALPASLLILVQKAETDK